MRLFINVCRGLMIAAVLYAMALTYIAATTYGPRDLSPPAHVGK